MSAHRVQAHTTRQRNSQGLHFSGGIWHLSHSRAASLDNRRQACYNHTSLRGSDLFAPRPTRRKASGGVIFSAMLTEPPIKRAVVFIDGQNLFHSAKEAFGYAFPNYDVTKLASKICLEKGWQLEQVRFYTGVPDATDNPFWSHFWTAKLAQMGREQVHVFNRPLRYRNQTVELPDGTAQTVLVGQEKGIDVRLALDVISLGWQNDFDVALIFSQDQDLSEVADEIRQISKMNGRWLRIASAYPFSPASRNKRGINGTDWIKLDRATYDSCVDTRDYRPKKRP